MDIHEGYRSESEPLIQDEVTIDRESNLSASDVKREV
jgi:hypothetical protein